MKNHKIKILFFIFDLGSGGAEKVLVNLVNSLDSDRYDITIRTIFGGGPNSLRLNCDIKFRPILRCRPFRGIPKLFKLFSPSFLHKIFVGNKYDIEIAYLQHIPTRIIGSGKNNAQKKYAFIHTVTKNKSQLCTAFRNEKEFERIYNNFDKLGFVSVSALKEFNKYHIIKTPKFVVHNVNEYDKIRTLSKAKIDIDVDTSKINFISIGRMAPEKGLDRLVIACKNLIMNNYTDWHLYILGDGQLKKEIDDLIKAADLQKHISLLGFKDNPYKYISKMDFYVCSSHDEGYSTAATEAIYLGVPILTTDCGGMHEIIADSKAGLIVENSQDGLNHGLVRIFEDSTLLDEMKEGAKVRSKDFSTEAGIKEFEDFIFS